MAQKDLRKWMKQKRFTLRELAKQLGISSFSTIFTWLERGVVPHKKTLVKFTELIKREAKSPDEIFNAEDFFG